MTDQELAELVAQRMDCTAIAKQMSEDAERIQAQVREELKARGVSGFDDGKVRVTVSTQTRESVKPEKLVELGVSVDVLKKATVTTTFESMRFTVHKPGSGE